MRVSPVSDQVNFPLPLSKPVIAAEPTKFELPSLLVKAKSTADCNLIVPVNTAELFVDVEPNVIDDVVLLYNWFKTVAVVSPAPGAEKLVILISSASEFSRINLFYLKIK